MNRPFVSGTRFILLAFAVTLCFAALLSRLYYLHIVAHDRLTDEADQKRKRVEVVDARRGDIVDRRGNLLATTSAVVTVGVDPQALKPDDLTKINELANILEVSPAFIREKFTQRHREASGPDGIEQREIRWHKLAEGIEEPVYKQVKALDIRAVYGNPEYDRQYPSYELAAHLLGFVNKAGEPSFGVEQYLDFYLAGHAGWRESERDGRRRELVQFRSREVESTSGLNVEMSIDSAIQHAVEVELKRIAEEYNPKFATIIVGEPSTGYILALANYPTFDPNEFWEYDFENQRNRAVVDRFEPGSTFKIVPAAGALNEGLVKPFDEFDCSVAQVEHRGRSVRLPSDHHPLEVLSVEEIVVKSSNRGAALLGITLGEKKLHQYAQGFGFGEPTGFDLGLEVSGTLHPVAKWDGLTISRLPMGHSVNATPLQVHAAMGAIANGGVLMEPKTVRRVFDDYGETVVNFAPRAKRRVVSQETAFEVSRMLEKVVGLEGTARQAFIPDYGVAGKTGTTQKIINGRYSNRHHTASFTGFFPVNDPRIVITVVVDDPQCEGVGYGGRVAAPAFKNIAKHCIRQLGIAPMEEETPLVALGPTEPQASVENNPTARISTILQ